MANRLINRLIHRRHALPSLLRLLTPANNLPATSITPLSRSFSSSTVRRSKVESSSGDRTTASLLTRMVDDWKFNRVKKEVIEVLEEIEDELVEYRRLLSLRRSLIEDLDARTSFPVPEFLDLEAEMRLTTELRLTMEKIDQIEAEMYSIGKSDELAEKVRGVKTTADLEEIRVLLVKDLERFVEVNELTQSFIISANSRMI